MRNITIFVKDLKIPANSALFFYLTTMFVAMFSSVIAIDLLEESKRTEEVALYHHRHLNVQLAIALRYPIRAKRT